jgi:hypothetical protein
MGLPPLGPECGKEHLDETRHRRGPGSRRASGQHPIVAAPHLVTAPESMLEFPTPVAA